MQMAQTWPENGPNVARTCCEKAVILHRQTKCREMNPFSIIGTGAAFLNYRKAKAEYDALIDKKKALEDTIKTYQKERFGMTKDALETIDDNSVSYPDGLQVSSVLRVGNLVGKVMRAKKSLVISNIGRKTYVIVNPDLSCKVFDKGVGFEKDGLPNEQIIIAPGQTIEVSSKNSIAGFENTETLAKLRDYICEQSGKKYITSCGKISLDGVETADIMFQWQENKDVAPDKWKVAAWLGKPGVLRYCMEAFYA